MANYQIKQSSTAYPLVFLMIDSSDHIAGKTGLSPTVTLSKAGASFASPSGAISEIGSGWYKVAGNATDTGTLGSLALHATAAGADPCDVLYEVVAHDVQDAAGLGLSRLDAAVSSRSTYAGGAVASVTAPVLVDLTTAVPTTGNTANSIADCLNAARAQGFGKWVLSGTTLTLYAPDGTTAVRTLTLDSSSAPTQRT